MNPLKFLALTTLFVMPATFPLSSQDVHLSSGTVKHIEHFPSRFAAVRTVDVWLPDGYPEQGKYAVLYMQDGQMLFDSSDTWNHQEWKVDETAGRLMAERKVRDFIVVAVYNRSTLRHTDYFPQKPFSMLSKAEKDSVMKAKRPEGTPVFNAAVNSDEYLQFLVTELKPWIDSSFSTDPGQQATFIAGSSMGGLISLYAVCEYPGVFGGAACLSTHWTGIFTTVDNPVPGVLLKYLKKHLPDPATHKFYFDHGTEGLDAMYGPTQAKVDRLMTRKGYGPDHWTTILYPGDNHTEKAWAGRLDKPLIFLFGK